MRGLLKRRTDDIFSISANMQKTMIKNARNRFKEKLVGILVSEFENVFTAPDGVFMTQDDEPWVDP